MKLGFIILALITALIGFGVVSTTTPPKPPKLSDLIDILKNATNGTIKINAAKAIQAYILSATAPTSTKERAAEVIEALKNPETKKIISEAEDIVKKEQEEGNSKNGGGSLVSTPPKDDKDLKSLEERLNRALADLQKAHDDFEKKRQQDAMSAMMQGNGNGAQAGAGNSGNGGGEIKAPQAITLPPNPASPNIPELKEMAFQGTRNPFPLSENGRMSEAPKSFELPKSSLSNYVNALTNFRSAPFSFRPTGTKGKPVMSTPVGGARSYARKPVSSRGIHKNR